MINIEIDINQVRQIAAEMGQTMQLTAEMGQTMQLTAEIGRSVVIPAGDPYTGAYEAVPNVAENIVLATNDKYMQNDITVRKIPYEEVTNAQGGKTATIGGY